MKHFLIILLSTISTLGNTQIITNDETKKETDVEIIPKESKAKTGTEIYVGASPSYTYRTLEINEGIFGQPLGYREDEIGEWTTGINAGVRTKLAEHIKFEIGVGFSSNKNSFDFTSTDSIFRYENTFRHVSFPIRLAYTFGDEISFYGGLGVIPKIFQSMKNETTTLDINNNENTVTTIEKDKFNFFLIDAVATVGAQFQLSENYGIYTMIEGRRQLNNTYDSQSAYIRKPFALGFNIGVEVYL